MFRKKPLLHKKPKPSATREGSAIKAAIKKRTKRIRRRVEKSRIRIGEVVDFEPLPNQVYKGLTTHGRKQDNDPIFRRRAAVA